MIVRNMTNFSVGDVCGLYYDVRRMNVVCKLHTSSLSVHNSFDYIDMNDESLFCIKISSFTHEVMS
jgi:hypothetical protein